MHAPLVEKGNAGDAAARLAAEKEIAGDIDRVAERQILIDHLDARCTRVRRRAEGHRRSIDLDRAGIGNHGARQHLAQCRLSRAIVADQPEDLARPQHQRHVIERLNGVVAL